MVTAREVVEFFQKSDLELAELVLEFGTKEVGTRQEARAKISANLKKARAARKPKGQAGEVAATEAVATPATPATPVAAAPVAEAPHGAHRRQHEQAASTSA